MSHPAGALLRHRKDVEFVEADVEIGFSLVDMAESESSAGNRLLAARVLQDADGVFQDIERRLERAGPRERGPFVPLVEELRRVMDRAKVEILREG